MLSVGPAHLITVACCAVANLKPPTPAASMRRSRYSYRLVKDAKDFVVNASLDDKQHSNGTRPGL